MMENNIEFVKPFPTFRIVFQITKTIIFEVEYRRTSNGTSYLATSASVFNRPKTDYKRCGQCQDFVLPNSSLAYSFYEKWDKFHCKYDAISSDLYKELISDLGKLKEEYNYKERFDDNSATFWQVRSLSMLPLKKKAPKGKKK